MQAPRRHEVTTHMSYLLEFLPREGEPGFNPQPVVDVHGFGRVVFDPNPEYDGRRIVEVPTIAARDRILSRNINGNVLFAEPNDLLDSQAEERTRAVVLAVLRELGLLSAEESAKLRPKRGPGRARKSEPLGAPRPEPQG